MTPKNISVASVEPKKPPPKKCAAEKKPTARILQLLAGTRQAGESNDAVKACNGYLMLPHRSLSKLWKNYQAGVTESDQKLPVSGTPTQSLGVLKNWCAKYDWVDRADIFDDRTQRAKIEVHDLAMQTGLAAPFARVRFLKEAFSVLEEDFSETDATGRRHNLWLAEPRAIPVDDGHGNVKMEVFDIYRYNAPLVSQLFQLLDDIAKETNGRRMADGSDELLEALILKVGTDRLPANTLARIAAGENAFAVLLDTINALNIDAVPSNVP